jgi:20S proteasome subunit alpha 7
VVADTNRRIFTVNPKIGLGFVGWEADGRPLAEVAQKECLQYRDTFGIDIPPHLLADRLANYMHMYTCYGSHRLVFSF